MTAVAHGGRLVLSVLDTGAGIPATDLGRVFEIFKTASTARDRAGSGLGLAIVKAIAESRGGSVAVVSTVGQGTTFTLRFPVGPVPDPVGAPAVDPAGSDPRADLVDARS